MEVKYLLIQLYLYRARLNGSPQLWWILLLLLLPPLPGFACSIHATWGPSFSHALYSQVRERDGYKMTWFYRLPACQSQRQGRAKVFFSKGDLSPFYKSLLSSIGTSPDINLQEFDQKDPRSFRDLPTPDQRGDILWLSDPILAREEEENEWSAGGLQDGGLEGWKGLICGVILYGLWRCKWGLFDHPVRNCGAVRCALQTKFRVHFTGCHR